MHLHLNVAIAPEPEIGEISGKPARVGDVVEAHIESEKEPALLQHKSVTLPSTCDSRAIQENATMSNEAPSPRRAAMAPRSGVCALVDGDAELGRVPDEVEEECFRGAHVILRIGGTRSGPTPGYPGPHSTQRSTPPLAM